MSLLIDNKFSRVEATHFLKMLGKSNSKEAQVSSSFFFRKKLAACQAPPNDLLQAIISELISCLKRPSLEIQLNASWALTNLACGSQTDTHCIVNMNGVSELKSLIENTSDLEVKNQALWAVGNIAADCEECRELVRSESVLTLIIRLLELPTYLDYSSRKIAIWSLVNLLRGGITNVNIEDVRRLMFLLHQTIVIFCHNEILCDTIWCIAYLIDHSADDDERISTVFSQPGLIDAILVHLKSDSTRVIAGSLRVIGNIITGTDEQTTQMLNYNILDDLNRLMNSQNIQISRESIWILSNVAAGTQEHVTKLFSISGMAESIFQHCKDSLLKKRKEAFWVLINSIMSATPAVYDLLMGGGIAHIFVQILREVTDVAMIERTLNSIGHALRERPNRRQYTIAIFNRVGLVDELLQIATTPYKNNLTMSPQNEFIFQSNKAISSSYLQTYFNVLPLKTNEILQSQTNVDLSNGLETSSSAETSCNNIMLNLPISIIIKKRQLQ